MKKYVLPLLLVTGTWLAAGSCRRAETSWDAGLLFPVGSTSLSIDNLLADSLTQTNSDQSITLVYNNSFFDFTADSLYNIPDTTLNYIYYVPFGTLGLAPGDDIVTGSLQQTTYGVSGISLTSAIIRSGKMKMKLRNDLTQPITLRYEIPCASLNGIPFDTTFEIPAAASTTQTFYMNAEIDLSNYVVDFRGVAGDRVNTITTRYSAELSVNATASVTAYPADSVGVTNTFTSILPYMVRGYFGNSTFNVGPEETDFSVFSKITDGTLQLEDLKLTLEMENNVGMDARVYINNIYSKNTRNGNVVNLTAPIISQPINFNRASLTNNWLPIVPYNFSYTLDNNNSNARQLIENLPDKIGYNVQIITNPLGNISGSNDFFFVDYPLKASLNIELPLSFIASNLTLTDTIETDFTSLENKEQILDGTLTINANNGFPFSAGLKMYLLNDLMQITDSLTFQPGSIQSAPLVLANNTSPNPTWKAQGQKRTYVDLKLNEIQTQAVLNCRHLLLKSVFDTHSGPEYTRIYASNKLDLQVKANFNYRVQF